MRTPFVSGTQKKTQIQRKMQNAGLGLDMFMIVMEGQGLT